LKVPASRLLRFRAANDFRLQAAVS
jgi:hypothetical protein